MTTKNGKAMQWTASAPSESRRMPRNGIRNYLARTVPFSVFLAVVATAILLGASERVLAQSASTDELFDYPDTLLKGLVSGNVTVPLERCRAICAARSGCAGFDHSPKNECRIFTSISDGRHDAGSTAETRSLIQNYEDPRNPPLATLLEKLKTTDSDGHELFALSKKAFDHNNRDVGMQAINLAMQRGNQDAKLEIAGWYDPRTFAQDRVDAADANKAGRSYFELALEGNSKADTLLTSLCRDANDSSSSHAAAYESFLRTTYCEGSINP